DPFDLWTAQSLGQMPLASYVSFLDKNGLKGARVGVLQEAWDFGPVEADVVDLAKATIALIGKAGAKVMDPVALGFDVKQYAVTNSLPSRYERVHAINHYLARQGPGYPFKNAAELLLDHPGVPMRPATRESLEHPLDLDRDPEYRATLAGKATLRKAVIDLLDKYQLDALIYPHRLRRAMLLGGPTPPTVYSDTIQLSPLTGLPALVVPMGLLADGNPVGLEILGRPWSEPVLLKIASGYEASAGPVRVLPKTTPKLPGDTIP
ncbi:MAG: amidase family protein, partial [Verrucomicrobia bacterium]|nr:amidase family protein [Verrucomicrobiota bacterium]